MVRFNNLHTLVSKRLFIRSLETVHDFAQLDPSFALVAPVTMKVSPCVRALNEIKCVTVRHDDSSASAYDFFLLLTGNNSCHGMSFWLGAAVRIILFNTARSISHFLFQVLVLAVVFALRIVACINFKKHSGPAIVNLLGKGSDLLHMGWAVVCVILN